MQLHTLRIHDLPQKYALSFARVSPPSPGALPRAETARSGVRRVCAKSLKTNAGESTSVPDTHIPQTRRDLLSKRPRPPKYDEPAQAWGRGRVQRQAHPKGAHRDFARPAALLHGRTQRRQHLRVGLDHHGALWYGDSVGAWSRGRVFETRSAATRRASLEHRDARERRGGNTAR